MTIIATPSADNMPEGYGYDQPIPYVLVEPDARATQDGWAPEPLHVAELLAEADTLLGGAR
jgi:hypothetical protein